MFGKYVKVTVSLYSVMAKLHLATVFITRHYILGKIINLYAKGCKCKCQRDKANNVSDSLVG